MQRIFRLSGTLQHDPKIDEWLKNRPEDLGQIAQFWFNQTRACGGDVSEIIHDGQPTACIGDAAFAYVNSFTAHVNIGFFHGSALPDPSQLLEGTGKFMRHVKIKPGKALDHQALSQLIQDAYSDIKRRLQAE